MVGTKPKDFGPSEYQTRSVFEPPLSKLRFDTDLMQLEPVQKERSDSFDAGVADPANVLVV